MVIFSKWAHLDHISSAMRNYYCTAFKVRATSRESFRAVPHSLSKSFAHDIMYIYILYILNMMEKTYTKLLLITISLTLDIVCYAFV